MLKKVLLLGTVLCSFAYAMEETSVVSEGFNGQEGRRIVQSEITASH